MTMLAAFMAEYATADLQGRVHSVGAYGQLVTDEFPHRTGFGCLVTILDVEESDLGESHQLLIEVRNEAAPEPPLAAFTQPFEIVKSPGSVQISSNQLVVDYLGFIYPEPGMYAWQVHVNGKRLGETRVKVLKRVVEAS